MSVHYMFLLAVSLLFSFLNSELVAQAAASIALESSSLIFEDVFTTINNWSINSPGNHSAVQATFRDFNNAPLNTSVLLANVSSCATLSSCYSAAINLKPQFQSTIFSNFTEKEYWFGFSILIPSSWKNENPTEETQIYHIRLRGLNYDLFRLEQRSRKMVATFCGSGNEPAQPVCNHYFAGRVALGTWMDFVINVRFATEGGFAKVWRNQELLVQENNLVTTVTGSFTPVFRVGVEEMQWRINKNTNYNWAAAYFNAIKIGFADSSFTEVYTGYGQPCGAYCIPLTSEASTSTWWTTRYLWGMIPIFLIAFFSIVLYFGSGKYRERVWELPFAMKIDHTGSIEDIYHNEESVSDLKNNPMKEEDLSYEHFLTETKSLKKRKSFRLPLEKEWTRFKGNFRESSLTRTIFWYGFAAFFTSAVLFLSAYFYGLPQYNRSDGLAFFRGLIPVIALSNWDTAQIATAAISVTMISVYFLPLLYLKHDFEAGKTWKNDPNFLRRIGVIIPCHKSAKEIGEVLRRVLIYIPPENVVVCDNGNAQWPTDDTFKVVKKVHPRIRYLFIQQGHKTRALWTGVHRLPAHVEYVMHLDDDTHLDENHMVFDESHFLDEEHVISVAFLRSSYPTNTVTEFTDFWYKITDHFHATQAKIATRCFVPGPCGLWKRDKFMQIFGKHPTLPFGEDIFGGFTTLNNGYAIRSETRCMVKTFAPDVLTPWFGSGRVQGYGASSLWKQRAHRWTVSALRITAKSLYSFFTYDTKLGICSNIAFRLYRFREYKLILVQLFYIPFCLMICLRGYYFEFFMIKFFLFMLPLFRNLVINYICWYNQPELQVPLKTVLLSPFFNYFLILCAIHGRWKCILWYLPCVAPNHGMLERCRPKPFDSIAKDELDSSTDSLPVAEILTVKPEESSTSKDAPATPRTAISRSSSFSRISSLFQLSPVTEDKSTLRMSRSEEDLEKPTYLRYPAIDFEGIQSPGITEEESTKAVALAKHLSPRAKQLQQYKADLDELEQGLGLYSTRVMARDVEHTTISNISNQNYFMRWFGHPEGRLTSNDDEETDFQPHNSMMFPQFKGGFGGLAFAQGLEADYCCYDEEMGNYHTDDDEVKEATTEPNSSSSSSPANNGTKKKENEYELYFELFSKYNGTSCMVLYYLGIDHYFPTPPAK